MCGVPLWAAAPTARHVSAGRHVRRNDDFLLVEKLKELARQVPGLIRAARRKAAGLQADVLVPELGMFGDEPAQQARAVGVVEFHHLGAVLGYPVVATGEVA